MGAGRAVRLAVAAATASASACSIWAAIDDPYKSEESAYGGRDASADGPADGPVDANGPDAAAIAVIRVVDAGFVPYAIAARGDTVYLVDDRARVHVAYDAGTTFMPFWTGDGGDTFLPTNRIAVSASDVYWTVSKGVRYCAADGGGCGILPSESAPTSIAASDPVVAWVDGTGVRVCTTPPAVCKPATLAGSKGALGVAAGPDGYVAWTSGGESIHVTKGEESSVISLPYQASVLATEGTSDDLYWEGQYAVGVVRFDGTASTNSPLASGSKPTQLFAARGIVFWSLTGSPPTSVSYCRFDTTTSCTPHDLASGLSGRTTNLGIVADSHEVLAVVSSLDDAFPSELLMWRLPP